MKRLGAPPSCEAAGTVRLGSTPVRVSRLALGTAPLGGLFDAVSASQAAATLRAAAQRGLRYVDTAPFYGMGTAEERVGAFLASDAPAGTTVSSKVGRLLRRTSGKNSTVFKSADPHLVDYFDFSVDAVHRSVTETLRRLGTDRLDVVYVHDPDEHIEQALAETFPALARLRQDGVVAAVGLGTMRTETAVRVLQEADLDVIMIAGRWTLVDRSAGAGLLPLAARRGVPVVAAGVFNSGVLADPRPGSHFDYHAASPALLGKVKDMARACENWGTSLPAAALQHPLRHPAVVSVVVGCRTPEEVDSNVRAFESPIVTECWDELDAIAEGTDR